MPNPYLTDRQLTRLKRHREEAHQALGAFRKKRAAMLREYVGYHFGEKGSDDKTPLNLIDLAHSIVVRQLAARTPKTLVSTKNRMLTRPAALLKLALDYICERHSIGEVLRTAAQEAIFSPFGVVKVGCEPADLFELDGESYAQGREFAVNVSFDDLVFDLSAKRWKDCAFVGDRHRVPMADAAARFPEYADDLEADTEDEESDLAADLGPGNAWSRDDSYDEMVSFWDLWLPRVPTGGQGRGVIVTMTTKGVVCAVNPWRGPDEGPYHRLVFSDVLDNVCGVPQGSRWIDMHELANVVFNKLGRQAERQKTILGVQSVDADDGERVIDADDGDAIKMNNPAGCKEYAYGGVSQDSLLFLMQLRQTFSYMNGNLDALGGLSAMADTAKQEELITSSANRQIAEMQDRTVAFSGRVIRAIATYLWNDPLVDLPLVRRVGGVEIPFRFTPEVRQGVIFDYDITINPYSTQHRTPATEMQALMAIVREIIGPLAPLLMQQGMTPNVQEIIRRAAELTDLPNAGELLLYLDPSNIPQEQPPSAGASTYSHRIYERVNRPGATRAGQDYAMGQLLAGGRPQGAELAGMMREGAV